MKYIMKWNGKVYEPYGMSNKKRDELITKMLRKLKPQITDKFEADSNQIEELYDYLNLSITNSADILISNQVPVPYSNMSLSIPTEKSCSYLDIPFQLLSKFIDLDSCVNSHLGVDILLFGTYDHQYADDVQILGLVYLSLNKYSADTIVFAIGVVPGSNEINVLDRPLYYTVNNKLISINKNMSNEPQIKFISRTLDGEFIKAWYIIQFMLLNPMIHDTYINKPHRRSSTSQSLTIADDPKPQHPRHISPIKIITHDIKDILTKQYSPVDGKVHRKNSRHSMCWYVRGHYRNYKSSKKTYIKPSWRGPMSQMKRIQARENVIDVPKQI